MSTCEDCLHVKVCKYNDGVNMWSKRDCPHFKDKSQFIEMPCAIGSKIWAIQPTRKIIEYTVNGIHQYEDKHFMFGAYRIRDDGKKINPTWSDYEIGKTVFLTKEEAEKALKERESNV